MTDEIRPTVESTISGTPHDTIARRIARRLGGTSLTSVFKAWREEDVLPHVTGPQTKVTPRIIKK